MLKLIFSFIFCLISLQLSANESTENEKPSQIGKYQLCPHLDCLLLLDTEKGTIWVADRTKLKCFSTYYQPWVQIPSPITEYE
jgi:hypothetical protein